MRKKSKTEQSSTQPQSVDEAQTILRALEAMRDELVARGQGLIDTRKRNAYAAHAVKDADARRALSEVEAAAATNADRLASVLEAISEAQTRVILAQANEDDIADRAKSARILELTGALKEAGQKMDDACRTLGETGKLLSGLLMELHGLGVRSPTLEQWQVHGGAALQTAVAGTPWAKNYRPLAPHERKRFGSLISGWATAIDSRVRIPKAEAA